MISHGKDIKVFSGNANPKLAEEICKLTGTKLGEDGTVLTAGGRVLGVTAVGGDLEEAIEKAYAACKPISFQDMHFRTDIGKV